MTTEEKLNALKSINDQKSTIEFEIQKLAKYVTGGAHDISLRRESKNQVEAFSPSPETCKAVVALIDADLNRQKSDLIEKAAAIMKSE